MHKNSPLSHMNRKESVVLPETKTKQEDKPTKRNDIKEIRSLR